MKSYRVWSMRRGAVEAWGIVNAENEEAAEREFLKHHHYLVHGCFSIKVKEIKK